MAHDVMRVERDPARIQQRDILVRDGRTLTFDRDPEKYLQVWLAMHQIYRRNRRKYAIPERWRLLACPTGTTANTRTALP